MRINRLIPMAISLLATLTMLLLLSAPAEEEEFGANAVIIELTDNDIELQVFIDGFDYTRVTATDPNGDRFIDLKAKGPLTATGGFSEIFFASEPSHFLVEEDNYDGDTRCALINLPADVTGLTVPPEFMVPGEYEFEILAIEVSGNSTISVGEFEIEED